MCGIVGFVNLDKQKINKNVLTSMQNKIRHRGPDGSGQYIYKNVAMAMRRLSIIDVKGGDQPLFNEDKSIAIIGNGEIYNYIELQKTLITRGHKLRTGSDIETMAHAYEEWGLECFSKFRGMFAIAMLDKLKNKLIIARDRMGEKPLYYTRTANSLYFGSELKSLLNTPGFDKTIDRSSVDLFFHYYYVPEPKTPFVNVKKIKSASYMEVDLNTSRITEKVYWDPTKIKPKITVDPTTLIKNEFAKACELTLRSDVPVGIALSGGIDSGSILAFSAPKYKGRMKAFSVGYEGTPMSDERELAKKLAKKFKVSFIEKEIKTRDVINHFPKLVWSSDDPIADIAAHSIYEVSKLAMKNNIKVLLGGNGGDEIFWGYPSTIEGMIKPTLLQKLLGKKQILYNNPNPTSTAIFIERLYTKNFSTSVSKNNYKTVLLKNRSTIHQALNNLRDLWLKSNVITLGDRMSMASSVELRAPFLDYKLIELALSSKKNLESYKLGQKYYFKKAMEKILPKEVLERPKKGFTPPVALWITGILKRYGHLLKNGFLVKEKILNKNKIGILSTFFKTIPTYTAYQLLVMEIWGRQYVYKQKIV